MILTFSLQTLLCVVCVILNVFRVMTFFLYSTMVEKKKTFSECACGCIRSRALVSTENTLEVDFYLHMHVSFHVQVTNVRVPLVDECWCKTTCK